MSELQEALSEGKVDLPRLIELLVLIENSVMSENQSAAAVLTYAFSVPFRESKTVWMAI
jgi:hypothetical protein